MINDTTATSEPIPQKIRPCSAPIASPIITSEPGFNLLVDIFFA